MLNTTTDQNDFYDHIYDSLADFVIGRLLSQEQATDEEKQEHYNILLSFIK